MSRSFDKAIIVSCYYSDFREFEIMIDHFGYTCTLRGFAAGKNVFLKNLLSRIKREKNSALHSNAIEFSLYFLAEQIVEKFQSNNIWTDLKRYNKRKYWASFVSLLLEKSFPVWDFFPSQRAVLEKNVLSEDKTVALQTPTSSGKTAICELLIYNEFKKHDNTKVLYLAPFRALAAELKLSFAKDLAKVGISSKATYGGNFPSSAERALVQEVNLLITTPEKFSALEGAIPNFISSFTMVICDEGHLLEDGNRGLKYELLLARLKGDVSPKKFTFISAIVPNVDAINVWLGGDKQSVVRSRYRATEIEYAFLKETEKEKKYLLDVNPLSSKPKNYSLENFIVADDFSNIRIISAAGKKSKAKPTFKLLSVIAALKAVRSGTVALFNPTKAGNAGLISQVELMVQILDQDTSLPQPISYVSNDQVIGKLTSYFEVVFGSEFSLVQFTRRGALYHHGDLPQSVREIIEDAIRREEVRLVVCTNTIAEGVNLPIKTIVVTSTRRFDEGSERLEDLDKRDLKNLFGRAGRAGKETKIFETGLAGILNQGDQPPGVIILSPQLHLGITDFSEVAEFADLKAYGQTKFNNKIDTNRVYITGLSSGARGSRIILLKKHTEVAAAIFMTAPDYNGLSSAWNNFTNIGTLFIMGTNDNWGNDQPSIPAAANQLTLNIYPKTLNIWRGTHSPNVWNSYCYDRQERTTASTVGAAPYDFVRWLKKHSKDALQRATLFVEYAEYSNARFASYVSYNVIEDYREALIQVNLLSASSAKTGLLNRLSKLKAEKIDKNGGKRYIIDFGLSTDTTSGNYNNMTNHATSQSISNLVDDAGGSSTLGFTVVTASVASGQQAAIQGSRGNGIYFGLPRSLNKDGCVIGATAGIYRFTGLNNSKTYDVRIYHNEGSSDFGETFTALSELNIKIGTTTKIQYSSGNNLLYIEFKNVAPSSGQITFEAKLNDRGASYPLRNTYMTGAELFQNP